MSARLWRPPLAETLRAFGIGIISFLASEPAIGFYNALSAELRRHPDLSRAFWELGPGRTRRNLGRILAAAAARGEIAIGEPEHAAGMLFGMWQGFTNLQLALAIGPVVDDRVQREGEVVHIVATKLHDRSGELAWLCERDAPFPLRHGRGDGFHHGSPGVDARDLPPRVVKPRDIFVPDLHIDTLELKPRDFR